VRIRGHVWCFEDDINTDLILPIQIIRRPRDERPQHMFEANRPGWSAQVRPGDILLAGKNYGMGSSRPAAQVMKDLGLSCLIAETINGLFFRNCVNYAFPALEVAGVRGAFSEGQEAEVDFEAGIVTNLASGVVLEGPPWPPELLRILQAGGLNAMLESDGHLHPRGWTPDAAVGTPG
jgi:3-isopropylmalate/(R)-2-methylmalate dehydratase small subunit